MENEEFLADNSGLDFGLNGTNITIDRNETISDVPEDVSSHGSYLVGVLFGLLGSTSRAGHYVTCKLIYERQPGATTWILLFAGFGGFLVSLVSSCLDTQHLVISTHVGDISLADWTGIIAIALLGQSS